jgi:epoxide hydrolase-like predicted phosphatase
MTIRAVVFDIGGVLEIDSDGFEPMVALPGMLVAWEARLHLGPGELRERYTGWERAGAVGARTEAELRRELGPRMGMDEAQTDAFLRDFWDVYLGELNVALADYFRGLRPRYRTALLSNSFVGARERERERHHFEEMTDLIVYSHEEGIAKPDPRIYTLTCERLGARLDETVFLDNVEGNVAAAHALGIHAILFTETAQAIADIQARLHPGAL